MAVLRFKSNSLFLTFLSHTLLLSECSSSDRSSEEQGLPLWCSSVQRLFWVLETNKKLLNVRKLLQWQHLDELKPDGHCCESERCLTQWLYQNNKTHQLRSIWIFLYASTEKQKQLQRCSRCHLRCRLVWLKNCPMHLNKPRPSTQSIHSHHPTARHYRWVYTFLGDTIVTYTGIWLIVCLLWL